MTSELETIETEITGLIEARTKTEFRSERDPLISNLILERHFVGQNTKNQVLFKDVIIGLLFKYFNISGSVSDAIVGELLFVCMKDSIPVSGLLTDALKKKNLQGRNYQGKDLELLALQVLAAGPAEYRTRLDLLRLFRNPAYHSKTSYCLHFVEFFARQGVDTGVQNALDALLDLRIERSEVAEVAFQLYTSLKLVDPTVIKRWYELKLSEPTEMLGNLLNQSLLRFVDGAYKQPDYYGADWEETLSLINAFSNIYLSLYGVDELRESTIIGEMWRNDIKIVDKIESFLKIVYSFLNVTNMDANNFEAASELSPNGIATVVPKGRTRSAGA